MLVNGCWLLVVCCLLFVVCWCVGVLYVGVLVCWCVGVCGVGVGVSVDLDLPSNHQKDSKPVFFDTFDFQ